MRRFIKILIGIPIVFGSLALMSGGIQPALQIIQLSLLCTLGISLVVWIPLCWLLGSVTLEVVENLLGRTLVPDNATEIRSDALRQQNISLTPQSISLIDYIEKGIKQGWSETQITSRLRAQGWNDEEIAEAQLTVRVKSEGSE
ncbi:hypothetical protein DSM106972_084730 [Dulcicalothrix desertica PCC 7102]|uniref:Uncharacterized protein n=1 Tax=Dulcicalothrix desertica PCC 7102 TaxID=232991 RepID=A0A433UU55_9CYAN|nr:hypothetical protein [Dulcicalothrix desertica]RUS97370.1 hypothetical protein DSM106972_084730 [Dulcicalothrix desertica PCC 7102]TWH55548.1 hypothetical protein CAL7102_03695 [Dulcicalothrix desertica PCC 7102]